MHLAEAQLKDAYLRVEDMILSDGIHSVTNVRPSVDAVVSWPGPISATSVTALWNYLNTTHAQDDVAVASLFSGRTVDSS